MLCVTLAEFFSYSDLDFFQLQSLKKRHDRIVRGKEKMHVRYLTTDVLESKYYCYKSSKMRHGAALLNENKIALSNLKNVGVFFPALTTA